MAVPKDLRDLLQRREIINSLHTHYYDQARPFARPLLWTVELLAVPLTMQEFLGNLTVLRQLHPVDCAAILHLNLVTTHPFSDGNGRTAQLLMNLALLQAGYILL